MVNFTLADAGGLSLAVLSYGPLLLLPGLTIARGLGAFGFRQASPNEKLLTGLVLGCALMPLLDSLVMRFAGQSAALAVTIGLAALALPPLVQTRPRLSGGDLALAALWFALVFLEWADFDLGHALYQPLGVFDTVKHAAIVQAIHDGGAPPLDPFFLRPDRVSYYYFFYTAGALSQLLGDGLISARAAFGGLIFWTGLALFAVMQLLLGRRSALPDAGGSRRGRVILLLLAASGLDALAVALRGAWTGKWLPDPVAWNEQITQWFEGLIWVPHHVTAMIAVLVGFLAATECLDGPLKRRLAPVLIAGLAFASALGLSVWVTFAAVVAVAAWFAMLLLERRWRAVAALAVIGLIALFFAAPQIHDLMLGRGAEFPVSVTVRRFLPVDSVLAPGWPRLLGRLVCLPLSYIIEFGILAWGSWVYWRDQRRQGEPVSELDRVLAAGALSGLLLGSFLQSTLFNNDLGWRVMLLPSAAALVWTASWLGRVGISNMPAAAKCLLAGGLATSLYAAVGLRAYYGFLPFMPASVQIFSAHPETQYALREAYEWAASHLPPGMVLQHDPHGPDVSTRAVAFGLYGRNPAAVSDRFGSLFGVNFDRVSARLADLAPVFEGRLAASEVRARASRIGIGAFVVTSDDLVWHQPSSWVWQSQPVYESSLVRIIPAASIADAVAGNAIPGAP